MKKEPSFSFHEQFFILQKINFKKGITFPEMQDFSSFNHVNP